MYEQDAQERPGGSDDGANGSAGDPARIQRIRVHPSK